MDYSVSVFRYSNLEQYELNHYRNSSFTKGFFEIVRDLCIANSYPPPIRLELRESDRIVKKTTGFFKKTETDEVLYNIDVFLHFNLTKEDDAKFVRVICESVFAGAQLRKP